MITMSRLPRLAACPGSAALPLAATATEWAELGHGRHELIETAINAGALDKLPDEIRALVPAGALAMTEVAVAYDYECDTARWLGKGVDRRYELGPTEIGGTVDLVVDHQSTVTVADWKGYDHVDAPDRNPQLLGYALAIARLTGASEVRLVVIHVEDADGEIRLLRAPIVRVVDAIDLDAFASSLRALIRAVDEQKQRKVPDVRESKHCRWCDHAVHCPAKVALIKRLVSGQERDELELAMPLTPETAAEAYKRLGHAEALLKRIRGAIYAFAAQQDIPLGEGRVLGKRVKESNEKLDGDVVHTTLAEMYGPDIADLAITRSATKAGIERALKKLAAEPETPVKSVTGSVKAVLQAVRDRGGARREEKEAIDEHPAELAEGKKARVWRTETT